VRFENESTAAHAREPAPLGAEAGSLAPPDAGPRVLGWTIDLVSRKMTGRVSDPARAGA